MVFNEQSKLWETTIPGQQARDFVEYYVTAWDNALNENTTATLNYIVALRGDANLDHIVNILDAAAISAHWYPGPPIGPLGYNVNFDINGDGTVDIMDRAICSAHWGKS